MMVAAPIAPAVTERRRVFRTVLSEKQLLDYFWSACKEGADRLELLLQLSVVAVPTGPGWDPKVVRAAFVRRPYPEKGCFSCYNRGRKMAWHHIIAVDHGGSNDIWNQVPICHVCHRRIHPWLEEEPDLGWWTTPGDMVRALATDRLTLKPERRQVHDDDGRGRSNADQDEDALYRDGEWE